MNRDMIAVPGGATRGGAAGGQTTGSVDVGNVSAAQSARRTVRPQREFDGRAHQADAPALPDVLATNPPPEAPPPEVRTALARSSPPKEGAGAAPMTQTTLPDYVPPPAPESTSGTRAAKGRRKPPSVLMGVAEITAHVRAAMIGAAFDPPADIHPDGKSHRFSTNGKRGDTAGEYRIYTDGVPFAWFKDWRTGEFHTWQADVDRELTAQERAELRKRTDALRRLREAEKAKDAAEGAARALAIWERAAVAPADHPYLSRKGVSAHELRIYRGPLITGSKDGPMECDGALIVPFRDAAGLLSTLEFIGADGRKGYLKGGERRGAFLMLGTQAPGKPLIIVEGYATGASIHAATGHPVAIAGDAGNLDLVARALKAAHPAARLVLAVDDDYRTPGNPGITKGEKAAKAVGAVLVRPDFGEPRPEGATDFNDMHQAHGLAAVRAVFDALKPEAPEVEGEHPDSTEPPPAEDDGLPTAAQVALAELHPVKVEAGFYDLDAVQAELLKLNILHQQHGRLVRAIRVGAKEVEAARQDGITRALGSLITADVDSHYLELLMSRAMRFERFDKRADRWVTRDPPTKWALALQTTVDEWRFPALNGVVTAPFLRPDGSLVQAPGYDRVSGIYADFRPGDFPRISESPTREDAMRAVAVLRDLLEEFPFCETDRDNHMSAAIAGFVTAAVRRALNIAPGIAINATVASSGKTTLLEVASLIVTGRKPTTTDYPAEETEMSKKIMSLLLAGEQFVLFDNVPRGQVVDSAKLNAVITAETFTDRILGVTKNGSAPTSVFWMMNGNSLRIGGDLTTRLLYVSLEPQTEAPEERVFRRDIHAHALEHRGALLAACLTVVLAYRAAGHPSVDIPGGYRFTQWDRMVRRALRWAGLPDPLLTQKLIKAADPEKGELESLLAELRRAFGPAWFTASEAIRKAQGDPAALMPQVDQGLLDALASVSPQGRPNAKSFGHYLAGRVGRIAGRMRIKTGKNPHTKVSAFQVEALGDALEV